MRSSLLPKFIFIFFKNFYDFLQILEDLYYFLEFLPTKRIREGKENQGNSIGPPFWPRASSCWLGPQANGQASLGAHVIGTCSTQHCHLVPPARGGASGDDSPVDPVG
jgi:hypothetical protein